MNSVNNQSVVPYNRGYEVSPKPTPIRYSESAEAQSRAPAEAGQGPSRAPVTTQQRAAFGTQSKIENAPAQGQSAQLEKLHSENAQLSQQLKQVTSELGPIIQGLQQQVAQLSQQLEAKKAPAQTPPQAPAETSTPSAADASNREGDVPQNGPAVPAQTPAAASPSANEPGSLEKLANDNQQLREAIHGLMTDFNKVVTELRQQINDLKQNISASDSPESAPAPTVQAREAAAVPAEGPATQPAAVEQSNIDRLASENEKLRADISKMVEHFKTVISDLQKQIVELNEQLATQHN